MSTKIDKSNVASVVELNMVQQGMLFQFLTDNDPSLYNVQIAVAITGCFEPVVLEQVLHRLQSNHEVLRSVFRWEEVRKPIQIILHNTALPYAYHDFSTHDNDAEAALDQFLEHDRSLKFDLTNLPIRFSLIKQSTDKHILVITHHHILYDGWSTGILLQEVFGNYKRLNAGVALLPVPNVSYAKIQNAVFSKNEEDSASYWSQYLQDYEPKPLFQPGLNNVLNGVSAATRIVHKFSTERLKTFAVSCGTTPATIIYAAFGFLLRKYLNANDVVVGTVLSLRESGLQGVDTIMGNFINTLPLRLNESGNEGIANVIAKLNLSLLERNRHAHTSYAEIKEIANLNPAENLFDAIIVIENYPLDLSVINGNTAPLVTLHSATERTEFPLVLNVFFKEDIEFEFVFSPSHITAFNPQLFAGHLTEVLNYIIEHKNDALASLNILTVNEQNAILKGFNQTLKDYPTDDVITAFQKQVGICPDKTAVTCGSFRLTYRQLDELSGRIAGYLKNERGVNKGDVVGVLLEREDYLIPVIYGILKAGAAYVPIDPSFPADRINSIVQDSEMVALVSRSRHLNKQVDSIENIIDLDVAINLINEHEPVCVPVSGDDLVYVIYTSGSTGRPKGVMIEHKSLIDRLWWMQEKYPAGADDVFLLKTPIVFDISVWEIFCWSIAGASLTVLPHGGEKDPEIIKDTISAGNVTIVHFVPSLLAVFLASLHTATDFYALESLKIVFACGEALQPAHVTAFRETLNSNGTRLINLYGPAEATLDVSDYECTFEPSEAAIVPIGKPLANVELYILDNWGYPAPVGVVGELLIGGVGLAKGYINNEKLTSEKFIEKNNIIYGRIYKTGDLARWMPDGNIEFLGRVDNQVKIRGLRIELGEIEHQVSAFGAIKECVVLSRQHHGDNYLVAYCITHETVALSELKGFLSTKLPAYMIPAHFVFLEQFPLLISGKLNRKALPVPNIDDNDTLEAANTPVEEKLVIIWAGILNIKPENISVTRSFFDMGGHSLKAMSMVNEIYRQLNIRITIKEVFEYADIRALASLLNKKETGNRFVTLTPVALQSHYQLSPAQERLYFLYEFEKQSTAYNGCLITEINGAINFDRLNQAIAQLVKRHEVLRTVFELVDGKPFQKIIDDFEVSIEYIAAGEGETATVVDAFIRPFNLNEQPPFRIGLVQLAHDKHLLLFDIHHIISDGLSQEIFIRDFSNLYNGLPLPALTFHFKDYAWHLQQNEKERIETQRSYWLKAFEQLPEAIELPTDFERPLFNNFKTGKYRFELDKHIKSQLERFAGKHKTTVYNVLLATFNILIAKLSGAEDITIGTPFTGRDYPGMENVAGMFVNTLALRNKINDNEGFSALLAAVKDNTAAAFSNQLYPYHNMIEDLGLVRDNGRNPLFNILFSYQDFKMEQVTMDGLQVNSYSADNQFTPFDLILSVTTGQDGLDCFFEFAADLFRADTVARFAGYWVNILQTVLLQPQLAIGVIDYIPADEKRQIIEVFNVTDVVYPDETIVSLFKKNVQEWPDNTAIIHAGQQLTYRQLDQKAAAAAHVLQTKLTGEGHRIGLLFEPGLDVSVAILGVLYAGFTFVPLSPQNPIERNSYILEDSQVAILLTSNELAAMANAIIELVDNGSVVYMEDVTTNNVLIRQPNITTNDLVYIIYTSGTTGQPKGVGISHKNLANYVLWNKNYHQRTATDHTLQMVPYYFDGFGANFYPVLLSGAAMVTVPHENRLNIKSILNLITSNRITNFAVLPSFYNEILDSIEQSGTKVPDMRFVVLAGERANMKMLAKSASVLPWVNIQNEYGPTEATIAATHSKILKPAENANIGQPIANTRVWVLGPNHEMKPIGVWGEICISGNGVANGYINNSALTEQKFASHPFIPDVNIYKTGDVGRWLSDGSLELRGRIDDQVKIRGHRIETSEIEKQLLAIKGVEEAVVVPFTHVGQQCLVAYYRGVKTLDEQEIRDELSRWLPEYMLPAAFVCLAAFPYTSVGKIEKRRLPDPVFEIAGETTTPCNAEEELLAQTWKKILGLNEIGTNTNFFSVGGDSIKSIQVCSALHSAGYELSVKDVFTSPTIKELAKKLTITSTVSSQDNIAETAAVSPIQQWFFDSGLRNKNHFNQAVCIKFNDRVTSAEVALIFNKLSDHHDILRARFLEDDNKYTQVISSESVLCDVEEHWLTGHADAVGAMQQLGSKAQHDLNIQPGKNMKLVLFQLENESRLLIIIHHLVIDGVSWRILVEDIDNLLLQYKAGTPLALPAKTTPYTTWAEKLKEHYSEKDDAFWNKLNNSNFNAPVKDNPGGTNRIQDARTIKFSLNKELTRQLTEQTGFAYNTGINDILMTALALACSREFDIDSLVVDVESHGRDSIRGINISRTLGWFTAFYPIHLNIGKGTIADAVTNVKDALRKSPEFLHGYLLNRQAQSNARELCTNICFNYLGQFDTDISGRNFSILNNNEPYQTIGLTETRFYEWEFLGMIMHEELEMSFTFSTAQYDAEKMELFFNSYQKYLVDIINHCNAVTNPVITASDFSFKQLSAEELKLLPALNDIEDVYTLSPMQEGLLFHALLEPGEQFYFEQAAVSLSGKLNKAYLDQTFQLLCSRHAVLRTVFRVRDFNRPVQVVFKQRPLNVLFSDVDELASNDIADILAADRAQGFDLENGPLIRIQVISAGSDEHILVLSHHHILMDGWCMGIILKEFLAVYESLLSGHTLQLPRAKPYSEYIAWYENQNRNQAISYWANYLKDLTSPTGLPDLFQLPGNRKTDALHKDLFLSEDLTRKLHKTASRYGGTVSHVMQLAWAILLSKYNNTNDTVFGLVVSGRPTEVDGIDEMIGLFINTLPVRIKTDKNATIKAILEQIRNDASNSGPHHYIPLQDVQTRAAGNRQLFNHIMVFENYPVSEQIEKAPANDGVFRITGSEFFEQTHYDLALTIIPAAQMTVKFKYKPTAIHPYIIENAAAHFTNVLEQLCASHPSDILSGISLQTASEAITEQDRFNDVPAMDSGNSTLISHFAGAALKYSAHSVQLLSGNALSYAELDAASNRFAAYLRDKEGVKNGDVIGVLLNREERLLTVLLGILKAGAAFVPMEVQWPATRVNSVIAGSGMQLVISSSAYADKIAAGSTLLLNLDIKWHEVQNSPADAINEARAEGLAYVIYTSGSTGTPKGVMISHASLYNYISWADKEYVQGKPAVFPLYSSIAFDLTITSIFTPLLSGNTVVLYGGVESGLQIDKILKDNLSTVLKLTPSHLKLIRDNYSREDLAASKLETLIIGGEDLESNLAQAIDELFDGRVAQYNEYGPTEATVGCMIHRYNKADHYGSVPIGIPGAGVRIYVLDKDNQPVVTGAIGELYIAGKGLAKGYLNNETLTADKFIADPFKPGELMYKTGDLAVFTPEGTLLYKRPQRPAGTVAGFQDRAGGSIRSDGEAGRSKGSACKAVA
ncbi:non-ribosomal peptide synthetase [Mucilaginibacter rubeus]|uniref:Amino acid adenylation domain-containing protein n=1 Tax=Mucilaginibacter rubeus TaxID=2027860 RepID=A0A5C1I525_9SPHI|nr:non-ribosomal peptide synthetase [Mucilaginibacter rubeus]QEM12508.1 amino acid adenylation domain-containing protein [Mucilaginibacter rubeus]